MEDNITIIEGPPPTFELVPDLWAIGIAEGPNLSNVAVTRLRTFNGPALVERCHRAWRHKDVIQLEFRTQDGLTNEVPIVAARTTDTQDGQLLFLWVRLPEDAIEVEFLYADDDDEDDFEVDDFDLLGPDI